MKIKLGNRTERGFAILLAAIIVGVVIICGIGGCVAGKVIENANKFKARRDHQLTNDVDQFADKMMQDYIARTGDTNAHMVVQMQEVTVAVDNTNTLPETVLQWSTNLIDWSDYDGPQTITTEMVTQIAKTHAAPQMFFRVKVVP